ncbi:hypothetical protein EYF80_045224 [Liparis tanakae]|uniref:Uncharacterized protein n=1 Tax=Liparis tanakae TaxID=230148 RepID=A0A4Z2FW69_9TELE|nr:hypothetical protein EYF80_045224 [Liparis tanakae]
MGAPSVSSVAPAAAAAERWRIQLLSISSGLGRRPLTPGLLVAGAPRLLLLLLLLPSPGHIYTPAAAARPQVQKHTQRVNGPAPHTVEQPQVNHSDGEHLHSKRTLTFTWRLLLFIKLGR